MTLVPPVPVPVSPTVTVAPDHVAVDAAVVVSAAPDGTAVDSTAADRPETGVREAAPVPTGLPVPPPRPADTEQGQEPAQELPQPDQGQEPVPALTPERAPESISPAPTPEPTPRLRHVRIDPPAGTRGEADDPLTRVPGTPPRLGAVAVPRPFRTTSDRRNGTPSVRPVRLTDTTAAPVGLPGGTERPAAVTPVPLPVPRPAKPITPVTPAGTVTPASPAGTGTPAVPPSTESRTEEPQP